MTRSSLIFRFSSSAPLLCALLLLAAPLAAQWEDGPGDVPYVPTPPEIVEAMLKLGNVHAGDMLYDLGCGDGRIVIMAAKKFGARGTGIDINPERIKEANENAKAAGVTDRVRFIEKNLFDADIHEATVMTLYLLPDVNMRLRPKLWKELKPGTRIVSHSFNMGDWRPEKEVQINGRHLYFWTVPAQKAAALDGEWAFRMPTPNGEMEAKLILKTEGERVSGTFFFPEDRRLEIQDGKLSGNQMNFIVRRNRPSGGVMVYRMSGTVEGDEIKGKTETDMDGQPVTEEWSAKRK
jgi:SAM-dependent methyltransferase